MDRQAISQAVRRLLTRPDVDLALISSKKVRAQLADTFNPTMIKDNKAEIDAIIIGLYNEIVNTSGVAEQDVKREQGQPEIPVAAPPPQPAQVQASTNGHAPQRTGSRPSSSARPAPPASDATSDEDEDEGDGSGSDFEEEERKPSTSKAKLKASPQKRRLQEDPIPASSPPVPLAMATGMTDEEYARQLQEEMNAAARGRSTRGGGFQKRSKKGGSKKNGSTSNGGGGKKKYRTKDYIDDSDAGEGHDGSEEDDDDGDSDSNAGSDKPKKAKKRSGGSGGGSGGYMKELALSEPLQRVCGAPTMARPTIVKQLWAYIRENNLQNPAKKSEIINDDLFVEIFGVKTMTMFSMNKYLKKAVSPIEG